MSKSDIERLEAGAAALREALERSLVALEYVAGELRELGEEDDANMMDRQAKENRDILAADAGRPMLERLRRAERERDETRAALEAIHKVQLATEGGLTR